MDPDTANAPTFDKLDTELFSMRGKYSPASGCFLIALDSDAPVGNVEYLPKGNDTVELKQMFVDSRR